MSVAKVVTVSKSRQDQGKCGHCGDELPKGSGYLWWKMGFRSNYKYKRCLKAHCFPKPSERETNKTATILAAQESFEENIQGLDSKEDIEDAVHAVGEAVREVADEYREAAESWENGNPELEEKADHYEMAADEAENWQTGEDDEPEQCDGEGDEPCTEEDPADCSISKGMREAWLDRMREEAIDAVNNIEFY